MKKQAPVRTVSYSVRERIASVWLCLLGVALPLTVHHAYFDITLTKATVFWLLSGLGLLGTVLALALRAGERQGWEPVRPVEALFAVFCLTQIVSTLLFRPVGAGLLAPDNRCQGILSFALYLTSFVLLRRCGRFNGLVRYALLLGCSLAALLTVLEVFGLDLLGLRAVPPEIERPRFFSTVGNISFLSALCVLSLPIAAFLALRAETLRAALPCAFCALAALLCGIAARAETFVLGALAFLALLPLFTREARLLRRVPLCWALCALAALLFTQAMRRWALYRLSELTALLCSPTLLLPALALCAALWLLLRRKDDLTVLRAKKVYIIIFCVLLLLGIVFLALANTLWRESLAGSAIGTAALFTPEWGSDRGAEWAHFLRMFREAGLLQKLIGCGSGSLAAWDSANRLFPDAVTDSAHNEYLHYLLTGGVIGLGCYLAVLVLALRSARQKPSYERSAVALGAACYAVQALVNLAQPFTTPLFFALLALLCSDRGFEKSGKSENRVFFGVALAGLAAALLVAAAAMRNG